jgi:hypothetical protein
MCRPAAAACLDVRCGWAADAGAAAAPRRSRWLGTAFLAAPTAAAHVWHGHPSARAALARAGRALGLGGCAPAAASLDWLLGGARTGGGSPGGGGILPADAVVHITVAWAVGGLMAYLSEWYRR